MDNTISGALATERTRDLQRAVRGARLAALARCCKPSTWRLALRRTADRLAALRSRHAGGVDTAACATC